MKCKNCNHNILKHIGENKVTYLHYNTYYFGKVSFNDKWCILCDIIKTNGLCQNPELYTRKRT